MQTQAAKTAIIIAKQEQDLGNYKVSRSTSAVEKNECATTSSWCEWKLGVM